MTWDENQHRVSGAFEEWRTSTQDIRAFEYLSLKWAEEGFGKLEKEASRIADQENRPPSALFGDLDVFFEKYDELSGGLWSTDYAWMIEAAAIKDMVTAFEVYAEKSLDEALKPFKIQVPRSGRLQSPGWRELVRLHRLIGNDLNTPGINRSRNIRHILTHQRGELRTVELRAQFSQADPEPPSDLDAEDYGMWIATNPIQSTIDLSSHVVNGISDELARVVRKMDPRIWALSWGRNIPGVEVDVGEIHKEIERQWIRMRR
ncbi:hypothetical protein Sru01_40790 [Sphaerisporangium rufum]|uniref:Uncharacterized protein n=1 Tax=Sphaerisporangium rufum TaxID=1381558 RepID=A0A919R3N5_9ACTN|nr:hypothetical protein [Sphaerisporangium rufum]GII79097.1 hypothetical protein Sru01_40790 [Sphaerisporangium rufum]